MITRLWAAGVLAFAGMWLPVTSNGQAKHTPTIEESLSLKSIGDAKISPDGHLVAYQVQQANWKDNEFVNQIWLVHVATGKSLQLTRGKKSAGRADWSPDGRWLAFITEREPAAIEPLPPAEKKDEQKEEKRDEKKEEKKEGEGKPAGAQIWLISPEGGEAWQLTKSESDIGEFHWSKDSRTLAFTATAPEAKTSKDRKEKYSDYEVFEKDFRQNQLWSVDVAEAEKSCLPQPAKRLLTDLSLNVTGFSWSPDSQSIAFSATANPSWHSSGIRTFICLTFPRTTPSRKSSPWPAPIPLPCFPPTASPWRFRLRWPNRITTMRTATSR